ENGGPTKGAQNTDREHCDGNRRRNGETSAEPNVHRHTAEENSKYRPENQRTRSEFFELRLGRNVRFKSRFRSFRFSDGSQCSSSRAESRTVLFRRPMIQIGRASCRGGGVL